MMLLALLFSCVFAGSFACTDEHCKDPDLANELMELQFLPNREQLQRLCPKALSFLECEKTYLECPGQTLEEMAASSDKEESTKGNAMIAGMSLARDLCNEDSSFHQDYVGSVECFKNYVGIAGRMCRQHIETPVNAFFDQLYPNEVDVREEAFAEVRCLFDALELACIVDNLGDACGSVAQKTALTALERMKAALKAGSCSNVENADDLKTKFLDFLNFEEEKRSRVQGIFDLLKRRR